MLAVATVTAQRDPAADAWLPTWPQKRLRSDWTCQSPWGTCRLPGALAPQVRLFPVWRTWLIFERPGNLRGWFLWKESEDRLGEAFPSTY